MSDHGGQLAAAAQQFGGAESEWVDLSTGISPNGWPVPPVHARVWQRLPESDAPLLKAASSYYDIPPQRLISSAGSQAAISILPQLFQPGRVLIPSPTFSEHARVWRQHGHTLSTCPPTTAAIEQAMADQQPRYLVIVNPNNPTGDTYSIATVAHWHEQVQTRGGMLVVDEAFMDPSPEASALGLTSRPGIIVLRSVGKFFGLAGVRLGFVAGGPGVLQQLKSKLGPWPVSHPALEIGQKALLDHSWQKEQCARLSRASEKLRSLFVERFPKHDVRGCALFQSLTMPGSAEVLFYHLARRRILVRLFADHGLLRSGLPGTDEHWQRLNDALKSFGEDYQ